MCWNKIIFVFLPTTLGFFYMSKNCINVFLPQHSTKNSCYLIHWYLGYCQKSVSWKMFKICVFYGLVFLFWFILVFWIYFWFFLELGYQEVLIYNFPVLIAFFFYINSNFNVNHWWKSHVAASFLPVPAELGFFKLTVVCF